jgi:uncharacterized protein (TIGR02391 family)
MEKIHLFDAQHLTSICKIVADTQHGVSGSEIAYLLQDCKIADVSPGITKWKRLFNALVTIQNERQMGNHVIMVVNRVFKPVQYSANPQKFSFLRDQLNVVLAFSGFHIGMDGKVRGADKVSNLNQALEKATRLHAALVSRGVHKDVLLFCRSELLQENYFHAVLEALKSIASKIRALSGLTTDGAALVQTAFALGPTGPLLAINSLKTPTDEGEQRGFVNLLVGLFGTIRNPLAHNAKAEWPMAEEDALDILTMVSLIHRKLDRAHKR